MNYTYIIVDEEKIKIQYILLRLKISYSKNEIKYVNFRYVTYHTEPGVLISVIKSESKNLIFKIFHNSFYGIRATYKKSKNLWQYLSDNDYPMKVEGESVR